MTTRKLKPDANQTAAAYVRGLTGEEAPKGEDLIGDPELRRQLTELKAKDAARSPGGRIKRKAAAK